MSRHSVRWILGAGIVLSVGCGPAPVPEAAAPARHLILVTVDTWRADHFLTRRAGEELTPNLASLAETSAVFLEASSAANVTSPGVAAILTGLLPTHSGVVVNDHVLPRTVTSLASLLAERGFGTAGFVANPVLETGNGFEHGFGEFELVRRKEPLRKARADQVVDRALEWLKGRDPKERVFLWIHLMEPHGPYQPSEPMRSLFPPNAFDAPTDLALSSDKSGKGGIPSYQQIGVGEASRDGRDYLSRYAAEVRYADQELGRFFAYLDGNGWMKDSAIAITADHGEALVDDHGYYFSHGNGLTQDQVHVPLLLHYPGCEPMSVADRPVSTIDLVPTILRLLGVEYDGILDGADLYEDRRRFVVSQSLRELAIRQGDWKVRLGHDGILGLAELSRDPTESIDLSVSRPNRLAALLEEARRIRQIRALSPSFRRSELTSDRKKELEALGYL